MRGLRWRYGWEACLFVNLAGADCPFALHDLYERLLHNECSDNLVGGKLLKNYVIYRLIRCQRSSLFNRLCPHFSSTL
jgi:hypothetical protein